MPSPRQRNYAAIIGWISVRDNTAGPYRTMEKAAPERLAASWK